METLHRRYRPRQFLILAQVFALPVLAASAAADSSDPFTVEVTSGQFDIHVEGSATLDARQSVTLSSDLPSNSGKIVWLVAEGEYVESGDPVTRFDAVPFEEQIEKAARDLEDARAALLQAQAEQQIQIQRTRESQQKAEHAIRSAEIRGTNLSKAEHPLRLATAQTAVHTAEVAARAARMERDAQAEMLTEGYGTQQAVDEAQAQSRERENLLSLARREYELLKNVVLPSELEQGRLDLQSKQAERKHLAAANGHVLAKHNAALVRLGNRVIELQESLTKSKRLLASTTLVAPVSGFVVYREISVQNERRKAQVGDSVWHRHGFIVIPDMAAMVAHMNVRESDIGQLAAGQTVELEPEAHSDLILHGVVGSVGTLASERTAADNFFRVRINIEGVDERLRPGMRARAAILTARHADVLRVPVEAVYYDEGETVVYTWHRSSTRRRPVVLGDSDGRFVIIADGLGAGDSVLLAVPQELRAAR